MYACTFLNHNNFLNYVTNNYSCTCAHVIGGLSTRKASHHRLYTEDFTIFATAKSQSHDQYEESDQSVGLNYFRFWLSRCKDREILCRFLHGLETPIKLILTSTSGRVISVLRLLRCSCISMNRKDHFSG